MYHRRRQDGGWNCGNVYYTSLTTNVHISIRYPTPRIVHTNYEFPPLYMHTPANLLKLLFPLLNSCPPFIAFVMKWSKNLCFKLYHHCLDQNVGVSIVISQKCLKPGFFIIGIVAENFCHTRKIFHFWINFTLIRILMMKFYGQL